jgi:hypothetical protein
MRIVRASSKERDCGPSRKRISSGVAASLPHCERSDAGGAAGLDVGAGRSWLVRLYSGPREDWTATTETLSGTASSRGRWLAV